MNELAGLVKMVESSDISDEQKRKFSDVISARGDLLKLLLENAPEIIALILQLLEALKDTGE